MIIKPIYNGTRLRNDHSTYALVVGTYNVNDIVEGDYFWEAPATGDNVKLGDRWLHVTKINNLPVGGWMAIIHMGKAYCVVTDDGVVTPPPPAQDVDIEYADIKLTDGRVIRCYPRSQ